jgi:predicted S18 family serine protease
MFLARRLVLSLALTAAIAGVACGDPPEKEMQQAQGAIDAARAAGADQYARDEFTAAEDALKRARDAVDQRDYRAALNAALDARERAQTAAKEAVNGKATARVEAEKALAAATAALDDARARLKTVENGRATARAVAAARRAIADDESTVQEARTAFDKGDYVASIDKARAAAARLHASTRDLDATVPTTGRRRH